MNVEYTVNEKHGVRIMKKAILNRPCGHVSYISICEEPSLTFRKIPIEHFTGMLNLNIESSPIDF